MKLLLDEHYSNEIAAALRAGGHDAVTVSERRLKGIDDVSLLRLAAAEGRTPVTNNAQDFVPLVTRWAAANDHHFGLLLTSDSSLPRTRGAIGRHVEVLRALMDANPGAAALADQVRWLP